MVARLQPSGDEGDHDLSCDFAFSIAFVIETYLVAVGRAGDVVPNVL